MQRNKCQVLHIIHVLHPQGGLRQTARLCIHIYTSIYKYCMNVCMYVRTYVCMYGCMYYVYQDMYILYGIYMYLCVFHMYIYIYNHILMYVCMYIYIYASCTYPTRPSSPTAQVQTCPRLKYSRRSSQLMTRAPCPRNHGGWLIFLPV